jgi:hypothetical protein
MTPRTGHPLVICFTALALLATTACGLTPTDATQAPEPQTETQHETPTTGPEDTNTPARSTRGSGTGRVLFDCTGATEPRNIYVRCW